ncbi:hypothetical protein GUITHDRAFT_110262 [Guillardia theta CCMP2712]|uniref:Uncharacterized protein n=1 Tax=Guillardia theta (strain CCMP2712) TaxID=905079 RepID=L1J5K7_GUITC|nr:hypothetical protein GUITHDRAFT_110262 [Guillardia theta CCMP2712]EKX43808.1 hypothetical protein GUITHDRAFT_110262 [Guillardia theta CCMP2712]|eukprot:XP_005830788.1 hypothetical protein GUITHDRAFT_110262 [Guillardia theta CCMP2712]
MREAEAEGASKSVRLGRPRLTISSSSHELIPFRVPWSVFPHAATPKSHRSGTRVQECTRSAGNIAAMETCSQHGLVCHHWDVPGGLLEEAQLIECSEEIYTHLLGYARLSALADLMSTLQQDIDVWIRSSRLVE